jgi:hypothetical protein
MPFAERYRNALNASNLKDDEQHKQTEVLAAAALADLSGGSGNQTISVSRSYKSTGYRRARTPPDIGLKDVLA